VYSVCGLGLPALLVGGYYQFFGARPEYLQILLGLIALPLLYTLWRYIDLLCIQYAVTPDGTQLKIATGVFRKKTQFLDLRRVIRVAVDQPLLYRLFGVGDLVLALSGECYDTEHLLAIKRCVRIAHGLWQHANYARTKGKNSIIIH
jgi:hypothetical protein